MISPQIISEENVYRNFWILLLPAFALLAFKWLFGAQNSNRLTKAPTIGARFAWIARLDYFMNAKRVIDTGYAQCKNSMFKLCGNDVLVVPNKYIDDLRNISDDRLNAILALVQNAEGAFALTDVLATSNLHTRVIQTRLTPKLGVLVPSIRKELDVAFQKELPGCSNAWVSLEIYHILHQIVGRASARVFVGPDLCRDERWLHTAEGYTNNVFITIVALRLLPMWAKPIANICLPSSWKIYYHWWRARRQLLPVIAQRQAESTPHMRQQKEGASDFLQMLMDEAGAGADSDPVSIAKRVLSLTLASNHTTTMALVEALYDLCAHPEYIQELREEVAEAIAVEGGWQKTTLTRMRKLDSFMKESQRVNPPSYMGFKRQVMEPLTLHDGLRLPVGTHLEMAIVPIQRDSTEDPERFDGFRYYKMRLKTGESHKHQFATTSSRILHFGHGKQACPGRFMASNIIKMILGSLLLRYDFEFPKGQGRPASLPAFEYSFPSPTGRVMFIERAVT